MINWTAVLLTFIVGAIALALGTALANVIVWFIKWAVNNNWESWQITTTIMIPGIVVWSMVDGLTKKYKP